MTGSLLNPDPPPRNHLPTRRFLAMIAALLAWFFVAVCLPAYRMTGL